jgi:hypothetical protein
MLSSRKSPATKDARPTPPGLAASSPSACRNFIAGWPKRPKLSTEKGIKGKLFGSTRAYVARFCWSRRAAAAPAVVAAAGRVLMDRGWMTEMSAMVMPPGNARRMSPRACFHPGASNRSADDCSPSEPREAAEGRFLGGGDARTVHYTKYYIYILQLIWCLGSCQPSAPCIVAHML